MKWKHSLTIGLAFLLFFLSARGPSEAQIANALAQTLTAQPNSTYTYTDTPEPTQTPEPTETPTPAPTPTPTLALPDIVRQIYDNIEVVYRDEFDKGLPGFSPIGWTTVSDKLYVYIDATLEITGKNSIAFFEPEKISANRAVIVRFKFTPQSIFTIGLDGVKQGQRIPSGLPGFRSVTMKFRNHPLAYFNADQSTNPTYFTGDLTLLPDVWYMYTLGFADGKQFIIKIWDPENPEKVLLFQKQNRRYVEFKHIYYVG